MREDVLETIRRELVKVAQRKQTITYGILASKTGLDINPGWHLFIGEYLDEINTKETSKGRPMLTAVVVSEETREPGNGFYKCALDSCEMWDGKGDPKTFWRKELERVWDYWSAKS